GLTVPWFWWVNLRTNGEFMRVFFWYHNVERGFGGTEKLASHPWWFYGSHLAGDFLPWTPFLVLAVWFFCKRPAWRVDPEARLGLIWLAVVVVLLSLMRFKRADYLLPAYPGAALFLACVAEHWLKELKRTTLAAGAFGLIIAGCVIGWGIYVHSYLPA